MKLIVGLGNPGDKYQNTRHNCGFMAIERLEEILDVKCDKVKFKGLYTKTKYQGQDIVLLKPMTYMNLSGESIRETMQYFKINIDDVLVIYDDLDLPVGKIRLRENGGSGGHNGIKNIIQQLKTDVFKRIRIGIDRNPSIPVIDYVLAHFNKTEFGALNDVFKRSSEAALVFVKEGFNKAMNQYN
jgi:peptidyl-tRNA hydrolase